MNDKEPQQISEEQIDAIIIEQAHDDSAWEDPITVQRTGTLSLALPAELASKAAFFARLYHATDVEAWLKQIIQDRIHQEEAAFAEVKREIILKNSTS